MLKEFNTFQKQSADSKLSTNTYLMSVTAVSGCDKLVHPCTPSL